MKYQTKVFLVDAVQFDPKVEPWPKDVFHDDYHPQGPIYAETLDGPQHVVKGDWIVHWEDDGGCDLYHETEFPNDFQPVSQELTK